MSGAKETRKRRTDVDEEDVEPGVLDLADVRRDDAAQHRIEGIAAVIKQLAQRTGRICPARLLAVDRVERGVDEEPGRKAVVDPRRAGLLERRREPEQRQDIERNEA